MHADNYGKKMFFFLYFVGKIDSTSFKNGRLGDDKTHGSTTCRNVSCIDYFVCNVDLNIFVFC